MATNNPLLSQEKDRGLSAETGTKVRSPSAEAAGTQTEPSRDADVSLRTKVLRGGAFLAGRQVIGMALSLAGVLLVTRVIGPRQYGVYAMAMGIVTFLSNIGTWGIDIYLLRKTEKPSEQEFHQA